MEKEDSKVTQVFKYLDKSNKGQLNKGDIPLAMRYLGIIKTQTAFASLLSELPQQISLGQFIDLIDNEQEHLTGKAEIIKAFKVFDEKNTGMVDSKELYHALSVTGEKLTENDISALMQMVKPDKDGKVDYHELVECLLNQD